MLYYYYFHYLLNVDFSDTATFEIFHGHYTIVSGKKNTAFRLAILSKFVTQQNLQVSHRRKAIKRMRTLTNKTVHTHTTVLRLCGFCPGQPG